MQDITDVGCIFVGSLKEKRTLFFSVRTVGFVIWSEEYSTSVVRPSGLCEKHGSLAEAESGDGIGHGLGFLECL